MTQERKVPTTPKAVTAPIPNWENRGFLLPETYGKVADFGGRRLPRPSLDTYDREW